jgi:hypothetical protein
MANRFREFVESIVYAGMKPRAQHEPNASPRKSGVLERFLSAPAPNDPLYLTNRTFGQKMQRVLLFGVPVVVLLAGITVALIAFGPKPVPKVVKEPTNAEIMAKVLPNLNQGIELDSNKDVEVQEVHFEHSGGNLMVGSMQNKSDHLIREAVVVFDLADIHGTQLGGITVTESDLAPGAVRKFQKGIEQSDAKFAVVREVRSQ